MKEEGAVINWFEINTPPGYYSINDTFGDILKTLRGKICLLRMLLIIKKAMSGGDGKSSAGMGFTINKTMLELAKGFTVKRAFMMLGGRFSKDEILQVNAMLNKVKKPKRK